MDVTPLIKRDTKVIQSYRGGQFKISNEIYRSPVIVMAGQVMEWSKGSTAVPEMTIDDFSWLVDLEQPVEVILLGTGLHQAIPSAALRRTLKDGFNISLEAMDTGAACRTYNVLIAEGRPIAAALKTFNSLT